MKLGRILNKLTDHPIFDLCTLFVLVGVTLYSPIAWVFRNHFQIDLVFFDCIASALLFIYVLLHEFQRREKKFDYLRHHFIFQLAQFACVPLGFIFSYFDIEYVWQIQVQSIHLLIFPFLYQKFHHYHLHGRLVRWHQVLFVIFFAMVILNLLACNWILIRPFKEDSDLFSTYVAAVYWLITTLATVGYGDIVPITNMERIFTISIMLMGVASYGVIIGFVSQLILAQDKRKQTEKDLLEHLEAFLKHYRIPTVLRHETHRLFRHIVSETAAENDQLILNKLPPAFRRKIESYMYIRPISQLKLFHGCSEECLIEIANALEGDFVSAGKNVFITGDPGKEMYLIVYGKIRIHRGDKLIAELHNGECFGEMALVAGESRSADATAETICDLRKLGKEKFDMFVEKYPELKKNLHEIIRQRKNEP